MFSCSRLMRYKPHASFIGQALPPTISRLGLHSHVPHLHLVCIQGNSLPIVQDPLCHCACLWFPKKTFKSHRDFVTLQCEYKITSMNKFIERANEIISRLETFGDMSSLQALIVLGDTSKEAFYDCLLDAQILLFEFNCMPLYEEYTKAVRSLDREGPKICNLLRKMIETAEFRSK